jgi:hypothetical protein
MKFGQFFTDETGALSMMRLTQFLVVAVILLVFIITNVSTAIIESKRGVAPTWIVDFPTQCVYMLALVIGGKVVQSIFAEKSVSSTGGAGSANVGKGPEDPHE